MFGLGERASAAALCCDQTLGGAMHKSTVIGTRARMDPVDTGSIRAHRDVISLVSVEDFPARLTNDFIYAKTAGVCPVGLPVSIAVHGIAEGSHRFSRFVVHAVQNNARRVAEIGHHDAN